MKKLIGALILFGVAGCTAAEKQELTHAEQVSIAWVRSAAVVAKDLVAAIRANPAVTVSALQYVNQLIPPGSDLSKLDEEAQATVKVIQTSTDEQLLAAAADALIVKLGAKK